MLQDSFKWFTPVAFAFVLVFIMFASPGLFSRENVLGKIIMVATLITATCYNRIAGIITLIAFIAILNNVQIKEGMANPLMSLSGATPASLYKSPCGALGFGGFVPFKVLI